jgi:glycosyltransferase involved in cell wall biosynthesis
LDQFDLVYIAALWQWIGVDCARLCATMAVPVIHGVHGGFSEKLWRGSLKKRLFKRLFLDEGLRGALAIHLCSEHEYKMAGNWVRNLPTLVAPNPVDPVQWSPRPHMRKVCRDRYSIPERAFVLMSAGRPDPIKNIDILIGAIQRHSDWYLIFVGEDNNGTALAWKKYAASLGVSERVIWTGFLDRAGLVDTLSSADLFALVSDSENFGMVVVEALLCGVPVMLSKEVGVLDAIKHEQFTITVERTETSIANALGDFRSKSGASRELDSVYIRSFAISKFAPASVAREFLSQIEGLMAHQDIASMR